MKIKLIRTQTIVFDELCDGESPEDCLRENLENAAEFPEHVFELAEQQITGEIIEK